MLKYLVYQSALVLFVLLGTQVSADEASIDRRVIQICFDESPLDMAQPDCVGLAAKLCQNVVDANMTTVGIVQCTNAEAAHWDAILNDTYQLLLADLQAREAEVGLVEVSLVETLRRAQRAWLSYRDAECELRYSLVMGGTIRTIVHAQCDLQLLAQRALELRGMLELDQ